MSTKIAFETPENIQVAYQPAGLGTRFVAWFVDNIIMAAAGVVIFFILMCSGVITDSVIRDIVEPGRQTARRPAGQPPGETSGAVWYFVGLFLLVSGVGSFIYFGASELFSRGQTLGKRLSGIRVVRADGFALEPGGILVRNIFRVIDQQPPLWLVPLDFETIAAAGGHGRGNGRGFRQAGIDRQPAPVAGAASRRESRNSPSTPPP